MSDAVRDVDDDAILPTVQTITVGGVEARVNRLATREFLALMRIVMAGLGAQVLLTPMDWKDPQAVGVRIGGMLMAAVPAAPEEFLLFLDTVLTPVDPDDALKLSTYLRTNPDLDLMIDLFEIIAAQERDSMGALLGKARTMFERVGPMMIPKKKTSSASAKRGGAVRGPARST